MVDGRVDTLKFEEEERKLVSGVPRLVDLEGRCVEMRIGVGVGRRSASGVGRRCRSERARLSPPPPGPLGAKILCDSYAYS